MSESLVSVVFPCFNAEPHLEEALDSLLAQSWEELEILALDDGSEDRTREILEQAAARDGRVRVLVNPENRGLIATLNRGVEAARGDFIARMDADDVSVPARIGRQVRVFEAHPDTDAVGAGAVLVDGAGQRIGERMPRAVAPLALRFLTCMATPIIHPTLLARAEVLRRHPYRLAEEAVHTEDYELFARMTRHGVILRNVAEPLLRHRQASGSVSRRFEDLQIRNFVRCAREHLERVLGLEPERGPHQVLVNRMDRAVRPRDLRAGMVLLGRLERRFLGEAETNVERSEIRAVAHQQRVDIVVQAVLRGSAGVRAAAVLEAGRPPWSLFSKAGRRYLASKRLR